MTTQPPPFNPNVPAFPSDALADSQIQFQTNFNNLFENFLKNHVSLTAASNAGNHTIIQLLQQKSAQQTDLGEISVYTKDIADQSDQIFLRYQDGTEFQFTNYQIYPLTQPKNQTAFFTFLPGRVLVYFGSFTKLSKNTLNLFPPIAKNIMTAIFCPSGSTPTYKPKCALYEPEGEFFDKINVTSGFPGTGSSNSETAPPSYYIILANV